MSKRYFSTKTREELNKEIPSLVANVNGTIIAADEMSIEELEYIKKHGKELVTAKTLHSNMVSESPYFIQYMTNPEVEIQLRAISKYADAIQFIHDPSEAIQLAAVRRGAYAYTYIDDPTEKVKEAAVSKKPALIELMEDPSVDVQFAAVKKSLKAFSLIKNPDPEVAFYVEAQLAHKTDPSHNGGN